jgi:hypothetical protein
MTFNKAAWAIDGARTSAALARTEAYANSGGRSGIVRPMDLRVQPLAVPGNGLRITSGSAVILNHYLSTPDESYVVVNPSTHTVPSASMPAAIPSVGYYLVCAVVGDPEFNQSGHPYMPSTPIPEELAADYEYVRIVIVPCSAGTTSFEQLGLNYPAYALARLEIPSNTTTITSGMIVNLRTLARARTERTLMDVATPGGVQLTTGTPMVFPGPVTSLYVPPWATHADMIVTVSGVMAAGETQGYLWVSLNGVDGPAIGFDSAALTDLTRQTFVLPWSGDVSALAGATWTIGTVGQKDLGGGGGYLDSWNNAHVIYDVQFSERAIA